MVASHHFVGASNRPSLWGTRQSLRGWQFHDAESRTRRIGKYHDCVALIIALRFD
jgi:hypothetical protein